MDEDSRMEGEAAEVPGPVLGPSMASRPSASFKAMALRPLAECLVGVNRLAASAGGGLAALRFADGGWDRCTEEKIN